jgi:hypothetical protein
MRIPRPAVHGLLVASIGAGIWLGAQLFAFFAG